MKAAGYLWLFLPINVAIPQHRNNPCCSKGLQQFILKKDDHLFLNFKVGLGNQWSSKYPPHLGVGKGGGGNRAPALQGNMKIVS